MFLPIRKASIGVLCSLIMACQLGYAGPSEQKEALNLIRDFAKDLCSTVARSGKAKEWELSATGKAQVSQVVKQLADLGAEGAAKIKGSEYEGVLQKDLGSLMAEESQCRYKVFEKLEKKLLHVEVDATIGRGSAFQYLDVQGLFLGMSRKNFDKIMAGYDISWGAQNGMVTAGYKNRYMNETVDVLHYFYNESLVYSNFAANLRFDRGTLSKADRYGSTDKNIDYNNKMDETATGQKCRDYAAINSKLIQILGSPIGIPKIEELDPRSKVYNDSGCKDQNGRCKVELAEGSRKSLNFKKDRVVAKYTNENWRLIWERSVNNLHFTYKESFGCSFSTFSSLQG